MRSGGGGKVVERWRDGGEMEKERDGASEMR
jgi:hypothetical protein